ncbi:MAG: HD-GYP domain-containing protein [Treponema sp.]|nr:HD-GYP domain-containing protein [Treponema sp.]
MMMEISASLLLISDRFAYLYRGDMSNLGFWMVRICNFLVYFFSQSINCWFNRYLIDLYTKEGQLPQTPIRLKLAGGILNISLLLLIVSQFTGLYYTFDEFNRYQRSAWFPLCYFLPLGSVFLQFSVIIQYYKRISKHIRFPLILFAVVPVVATVVQVFNYGLSLTNMTMVGEVAVLYIFVLIDMNKTAERANKLKIEMLKKEQQTMQTLFGQTAEALANAIDAKDSYTHGHSARVADYSRKIAKLAGRTKQECDEIYFAGLLHDVGKIGIPGSIINKNGKLTDEEFAEIKKHPLIGSQILSSITKSPYLSIGAKHHHERFDGKGYPAGLKGDDIPYIARIIAVADTYDAMTSRRSYRDPIPQQQVREEIVKGMETQFDPFYAKLMIHLIDRDTEYKMKEYEEVRELAGKNGLTCTAYRKEYSEGIHLTDTITEIRLHSKADEKFLSERSIPSFILFDALDARIHATEQKKKDMRYFEYGEIRFDGKTTCSCARNIESTIIESKETPQQEILAAYRDGIDYVIEGVKYKDHIQLKISSPFQTVRVIVASKDVARYAYLGLTGEHCSITNVDIKKSTEKIGAYYIPRIAETFSYIDSPAGDIPNIQIDDWCAAATEGIVLKDKLEITFHAKSLPTAHLLWHCPFISIFHSSDKQFRGKDYKEFAVLRLDGETWESTDYVNNKILINKNDDFDSWDTWKAKNQQGMDCSVSLKRSGNTVTMHTVNGGIEIRSRTTIKIDVPEILVAITGDQCAITNIHIKK